ncbi:MAG TPA: ATP-binding cassette domain-containing protein [Verrucomicrobiales bacterium]|jgi:ABC-2 type transport system ATP-binding protein|nr:ATP-binding cassette domain-containing protein [Verrucomicrobiales bacterium]
MIEIKNLSKHFGPKVAVDNLSLSVQKGEVLGFLGPNGAGKSTTMRMITGYLPPSAGSVTVGGEDMLDSPNAAKRKIGYLPESAPLYQDMTVTSFLNFAAELRGMNGSAKKDAVSKAIDTCFLHKVRHQAIDTLSKGYRHRTCLAQAIIHDPEVLILDEPTDGLDPNQKDVVRNLIKEMGKTKAIIFSTHILEEVEACCSRAIIIDQGRIVADGTPIELRRRATRAGSVHVKIEGPSGSDIRQELSNLRNAGNVDGEAAANGFTGVIRPRNKASNGALSAEIYGLCQSKGLQLLELHEDQGRLDDMFRELTSQTQA